jgi:5-methylcytosine-specific restriction endonuclease McrA
MGYLTNIKNELREKGKLDNLTAKRLVLLEQSFFKDHAVKCEKCGRETNLTLDHTVPKDILKQFGIDTDREFMGENLRILCRPCNAFKGKQLDFSTPKTKEILTILLNKI